MEFILPRLRCNLLLYHTVPYFSLKTIVCLFHNNKSSKFFFFFKYIDSRHDIHDSAKSQEASLATLANCYKTCLEYKLQNGHEKLYILLLHGISKL